MPARSDSAGAPDGKGFAGARVTPCSESWARRVCAKIRSSQSLGGAACAGSLSVFLALLLKCAEWRDAEGGGSSSSGVSRSASSVHSAVVELLQSCWVALSPPLTLLCAFFWLGVYSARCGLLTHAALCLLTLCHLGEAAARSLLDGTDERHLSAGAAAGVVLVCVAAGALMVARLHRGTSLILLVSLLRGVSLFSLQRVRAAWRPYAAYLLGVLGILLARYADRLLPSQGRHKEGCTPVTGSREEIPVLKRRRRSSSVIASDMAHSQSSSKSHRRTSLPCIQRDQVGSLVLSLFFLIWPTWASFPLIH